MVRHGRRPFLFCLLIWLFASCQPLPAQPTPPAQADAPTLVEPTFTSAPTLTPQPTAPQPTPQPTPIPAAVYAGPAGCLTAVEQAGRSTADMLAYADQLLEWKQPLARRLLPRARNALTGEYALTGEDVLAFSTADLQNRYLIQDALNALHVAGFAAWLRKDEKLGEHILAVPLRPGVFDGPWSAYVRAYFAGSDALPEGDSSVIETLKLTPCEWMVQAGLAPRLPAGTLEEADWSQPDFAAAALAYLAPVPAEADAVAHRIGWLDGRSESPALMCGPLAWAILNDARAFPPGYGGWVRTPKSFWLPKPSENGRPWSLFPPDTYTLRHFDQPLGTFDLRAYPLEVGDLLYTYSGSNGFDHVLIVSESDAQGNRFAVTNLVQVTPVKQVTIQRVLLYNDQDPTAGILRNAWARDLVNGRTGDKAFEVFRWTWREKDIRQQAAQYNVKPGDTLPLVAARWHTPPEAIVSANRLDPSLPLKIGQELTIPPNP